MPSRSVAVRPAGCHTVDSSGSGGSRNGMLTLLSGEDEAIVACLVPLFAHFGRPIYTGRPDSGEQ